MKLDQERIERDRDQDHKQKEEAFDAFTSGKGITDDMTL